MEVDITSPKEVSFTHYSSLIDLSPAPCQYNLKSDFGPAPTNKAISFGIAREAYSKVYIKESPPIDKAIPGPGQYTVPALIGSSQKFTMRPKTVNARKSY